MRAACFGQRADVRVAGKTLDDFVLGDCLTGVGIVAADRFFLADFGVVADRFVDDVAVVVEHAGDDGEVLFFDVTRFELLGQSVVGLVILGDGDDAAGVAIESMDDAGASGSAATAERGEVVGQSARESAFPMAFGRVDDHAGRLVEDDHRIVFVDNVEWDRLRRGAFARYIDLGDCNFPTGFKAKRGLGLVVGNVDVAGVNGAADRGPAERGKSGGKKYVKPLASLFGQDFKLLRPGFGGCGVQRALHLQFCRSGVGRDYVLATCSLSYL